MRPGVVTTDPRHQGRTLNLQITACHDRQVRVKRGPLVLALVGLETPSLSLKLSLEILLSEHFRQHRALTFPMHYVPIHVVRFLSEVPNYVSAKEPEASSGAIVEGRDIGRPVVADLGTDLDLWADPMLPAGRDVDVARGIARALALHVIVELDAHREIVERADAIVPEGEQAEFVGRAGWQYGIADRLPRRVHHAVPGRAEIGIDWIVDVARALVSFVPDVALIHVIAFERDMNLLVELVIVRAAVPVHVVVAPSDVVQVVDAEIDCVVARIGLVLDAAR